VELDFIKKCLQLILEMDVLSVMVVVEMMAQYILAPPLFRFVNRLYSYPSQVVGYCADIYFCEYFIGRNFVG